MNNNGFFKEGAHIAVGAVIGLGAGVLIGLLRWAPLIGLVLAYLAGKHHWFN